MGKVDRVGKEVGHESDQDAKNENRPKTTSSVSGCLQARGWCRAQGNLLLGLNGRMKKGNSDVPVPTFLTKNANGRIWKASTALAVSSRSSGREEAQTMGGSVAAACSPSVSWLGLSLLHTYFSQTPGPQTPFSRVTAFK